jgi:hypothetical protein
VKVGPTVPSPPLAPTTQMAADIVTMAVRRKIVVIMIMVMQTTMLTGDGHDDSFPDDDNVDLVMKMLLVVMKMLLVVVKCYLLLLRCYCHCYCNCCYLLLLRCYCHCYCNCYYRCYENVICCYENVICCQSVVNLRSNYPSEI